MHIDLFGFEIIPGSRYYHLLLSLMAASIGIWVLVSLHRLLQALRSARWRRHKAVITRLTFDKSSDDDDEYYFPRIAYRYQYLGRSYEGRRYSYRWLREFDYGKLARRFQGMVRGSEINIHVDPLKPSRSVVKTGADSSLFIEPLLGLGVLVLLVVGW